MSQADDIVKITMTCCDHLIRDWQVLCKCTILDLQSKTRTKALLVWAGVAAGAAHNAASAARARKAVALHSNHPAQGQKAVCMLGY